MRDPEMRRSGKQCAGSGEDCKILYRDGKRKGVMTRVALDLRSLPTQLRDGKGLLLEYAVQEGEKSVMMRITTIANHT
ncbi:hypothetical protein E2C01_058413 [Portunus trituberculatus]|uniref:Uncharacterized protein n=1 Tax=Portunus trituberculatus TaxID=210409 RepID=A0A5B7GVH7_PORTR|nr:hypothetical protein [Portunus trituberculatus]